MRVTNRILQGFVKHLSDETWGWDYFSLFTREHKPGSSLLLLSGSMDFSGFGTLEGVLVTIFIISILLIFQYSPRWFISRISYVFFNLVLFLHNWTSKGPASVHWGSRYNQRLACFSTLSGFCLCLNCLTASVSAYVFPLPTHLYKTLGQSAGEHRNDCTNTATKASDAAEYIWILIMKWL